MTVQCDVAAVVKHARSEQHAEQPATQWNCAAQGDRVLQQVFFELIVDFDSRLRKPAYFSKLPARYLLPAMKEATSSNTGALARNGTDKAKRIPT